MNLTINTLLPSRGAIRTSAVIVAMAAILVSAVRYAPFAFAADPTISIDSITDAVGVHLPPFDFACDSEPLYGAVSVAGGGAGSAPPGQIQQYGVEVDWGDGVMQNSDDDPGVVAFVADPPSGQSDFTYTYNAGPHTYTTAGAYIIHTRLYHQNPSGNDSNADVAITVDTCIVVIPPGTGIVNVMKVVDGGSAAADDFSAVLTNNDVVGSAFPLSESAQPIEVEEGTYEIVEVADPNYTTTYSDGCSGTIAEDDVVDCTITNTFIPTTAGSLTVSKTVTNDNGGTAVPSDFSFVIAPAIDEDGDTVVDDGILTIPEGESSVTFMNVPDGSYSIVEVAEDGYAFESGTGTNCSFDGETATATVASGVTPTDASCEFTNDDQPAQVTVIKTVINDNEGTSDAADFAITGEGTNMSPDLFPGDAVGTVVTLDAGAYSFNENEAEGYAVSYSTDCSGTIGVGESRTCTITNDDVEIVVPESTITVDIVVVNDDGGTAVEGDYGILVDGIGVFENSPTVFAPDTYLITQTGGPGSGYTTTFTGDCNPDGSLDLGVGENAVCTITNDDIAPEPTTGTLTVIKVMDGGDNEADDFMLAVRNVDDPGEGDTLNQVTFPGSEQGEVLELEPATYLVTESLYSAEYEPSFSGDCDEDGYVTVEAGESYTCTMTNTFIGDNGGGGDDEPTTGSLIIRKFVVGGDADSEDFRMLVEEGEFDTSVLGSELGQELVLEAGTYTVSEEAADQHNAEFMDLYEASFDGACDEQGVVTVEAGSDYTCTVTNTYIGEEEQDDERTATLIVYKRVYNDQEGTSQSDDFTLLISGNNPSATEVTGSEDGVEVQIAPGAFSVTEDPVEGYATSYRDDCSGTIEAGQTLECTVVNDDIGRVGGGGGNSGGGSGGSGGNGGDNDDADDNDVPEQPEPQVLGETDEVIPEPATEPVEETVVEEPAAEAQPVPEPQVLGAVDELPRTGIPAVALLAFAAPVLWAIRKRA